MTLVIFSQNSHNQLFIALETFGTNSMNRFSLVHSFTVRFNIRFSISTVSMLVAVKMLYV